MDVDGAYHSAPVRTRPQSIAGSMAPSSFGPASFSSVGSSSSIGPGSLPEEPEFKVHEVHEARPKDSEPNDVYESTSHPVGLPNLLGMFKKNYSRQ